MLKIYNSLTKRKEPFIPLNDKKVNMYVCGITPYDTTHLGHAFTYIFFDVLQRYLTFQEYKVIYTQNVTDIDDDILKKAKETGKNWIELGQFWTKRFIDDMKFLNVLAPTHYIKATDSIDLMISMIKVLIDKGFAYQKEGNVYFDVKKVKDYGKLSRLAYDEMIIFSKKRGGNPNDPFKKNPLDFVLWQISKEKEPYWESPWGKGRPGWHIECSAMICQYLGDQIDIHGGGKDLIFPHHESEIAESESYTGKKPFVKYWMHTAMLCYKGEKMAKSVGNLVMVSDLLKIYSANEIRYILLSNHYRTPWEFTEEKMIEARNSVKELEKTVDNYKLKDQKTDQFFINEFKKIMDDDLNTPKALSFIKSNLNKKYAKTALETLGFNLK